VGRAADANGAAPHVQSPIIILRAMPRAVPGSAVEPIPWPVVAAWVLGVHAALPPVLAAVSRYDARIALGVWGAIHVGWPVVLWFVRARLAGQWVEAGLLCALGHVVTLASAAVVAVVGHALGS